MAEQKKPSEKTKRSPKPTTAKLKDEVIEGAAVESSAAAQSAAFEGASQNRKTIHQSVKAIAAGQQYWYPRVSPW